MLSNSFLYKTLLTLLITVSVFSNSFETVIVFSVLSIGLLLMSKKVIVSNSFFNLLFPLFFIVIIALLGLFFRKTTIVDVLKDFFYIIKPILFLLIGYFISQKINDKTAFCRIIIYTATGFAAFHIIQFLIYFEEASEFSISILRGVAGRDNFLELIAIALIIANTKYKQFKIRFLKGIVILLAVSFILYFSRTMSVLLILVSLAFLGYIKVSKKGLKYIFISVFGLGLLYAYLFSIDIKRDSKNPIDNFLYKLKLAPAEIFVTKGSFDIKDHANLWDHWRAYEASKAFGQLNEGGVCAWSFGLGIGSLVDLDFYAPLSDDSKGMRYISLLHNGYAFVLYKTGIIGILLYFIFLLGNYFIYKNTRIDNPLMANVIFGITLFYLCSSLVISGIYNLTDPVTLVLGGVLFLSQSNTVKVKYK
jgi:hypothetical protein